MGDVGYVKVDMKLFYFLNGIFIWFLFLVQDVFLGLFEKIFTVFMDLFVFKIFGEMMVDVFEEYLL